MFRVCEVWGSMPKTGKIKYSDSGHSESINVVSYQERRNGRERSGGRVVRILRFLAKIRETMGVQKLL